jgi:hypothetical protein
MSYLKVSKIEGLSTSGGIRIPPDASDYMSIDRLQFNVISRGSPSVSDPLVTLESFDQFHYYETTGTILNLRTGLLANSIYEFTYTSSAGVTNIDFVLQPNGTTYTNEFVSQYYHTLGAAAPSRINQTLSQIYFDHFGGLEGTNPMGTLRLSTGPTNKYMQYVGSDTASIAFGYCRWTNNARSWDWLGVLTFNGENKRCWVRRVA